MTIEAAILKNIEKLPDSVKEAVFLYTEFLVSQYHKDTAEELDLIPKKPCFAGSMKGTFVLPLPDDFDDPYESSLAKDWLIPEEDEAWQDL